MTITRRVLFASAVFTVLFALSSMSRTEAAEYRHHENSLNHLGITPQSVSHNSNLIRRALNRESRRINPVNQVEPYGGALYSEPRYWVEE